MDKMTIPVMRVRDRLDAYVGKKDYNGAARHLEYWRKEAQACGDLRGEFFVLNEMMGVYRKKGDGDSAIAAAEAATDLIPLLGDGESASAGTAYVNAGTVYDCFGYPDKALGCFGRALPIYEKELEREDARLGGLYNNMALALADLKRIDEAFGYYGKALEVMKLQPNGQLEQAITYLNMANAAEEAKGLEAAGAEIEKYLQTAEDLLADPALPRNGYYAFVCEKCAPTFDYYGWFMTADELQKTADRIYKENGADE